MRLTNNDLLAEGGRRFVYINPEDNTKLLKIVKQEVIDRKLKKLKFYKKFRFRKVVDENTEDYNAYKVYNKKSKDIFNFIPKLYGYIDTNLGKGLVTEYICNYDGTAAMSLKNYIQLNGIDKEIWKALKLLYKQLLDNCLVTRELKDFNVVVQIKSDNSKRLYIVDGFGNQELIPLSNYVKCIARRKIRKHFKIFIRNILSKKSKNIS